jgi:hypothetical protein
LEVIFCQLPELQGLPSHFPGPSRWLTECDPKIFEILGVSQEGRLLLVKTLLRLSLKLKIPLSRVPFIRCS